MIFIEFKIPESFITIKILEIENFFPYGGLCRIELKSGKDVVVDHPYEYVLNRISSCADTLKW